MANPKLIVTPFAENGIRNDIPEAGADQPQKATMSGGWGVVTQTPINEGGIPPERADFNGLGHLTTSHLAFLNRGQWYGYDATFAGQIGGYPLHARLQLDNGDIVKSTIPNNTNNPNVNMTGWINKDQNISYFVNGLSDLNNIDNPKNNERAFVRSIEKWYTFYQDTTENNNGVTVVGKWVMDVQNLYYASWFAEKNIQVDQSEKLMTGYAYATSKKRPFVIDGVFYGNSVMDGVSLGGVFKALSNSVVIFNPDSSINIIPNNQTNYAVLEVYNVENVVFVGAKFIGDKDQHTGSTGEWGHGVNLYSSKNIMFTGGLTIENCWGDGIYFGRPFFIVGTYSKPENISIDILNVNNVRRNAISLCAAKDLYIDKSNLRNISGAAPASGVDIEPEEGDGLSKSNLENVVLNNTYIENALYSVATNIAGNRHVDVRFTGTTVFNNTSYPSAPIGFSVNIFTLDETPSSLNQTGEVYFENILMIDKFATNKFYAICDVSLPKGGLKLTINNLQLDTDSVAMFFSNNRATEFSNQMGLKINNISRLVGDSFYIVNNTTGVAFTFGHHLGFDEKYKVTSSGTFQTSDSAYIGGYSEHSVNFVDSSTLLSNRVYLTPVTGGSGTYARINLNCKRRFKFTMNPSLPVDSIGYGMQMAGKIGGLSKRLESTTQSASIDISLQASGDMSINSSYGNWSLV